MARLDNLHWQVDPGDNWAAVAAKIGCTRKVLLDRNGEPQNNPSSLQAGQIIHTPLVGVGG